jgi:hypothetical protein
MYAEFAADEHGTIWFKRADDIMVRDVYIEKPKELRKS